MANCLSHFRFLPTSKSRRARALKPICHFLTWSIESEVAQIFKGNVTDMTDYIHVKSSLKNLIHGKKKSC